MLLFDYPAQAGSPEAEAVLPFESHKEAQRKTVSSGGVLQWD